MGTLNISQRNVCLYVIDQFEAEISTGNVKVATKFILVRHGRCIPGNVTVRELGVLYIGPNVAPGGTS